VLLHQLGQSAWVGALQRVDDGSILDEGEGGHGPNRVALCNLFDTVDIDFQEDGRGSMLVREGCKCGCNGMAWTAPSGVEVDDDDFPSCCRQLLVELSCRCDLSRRHAFESEMRA